MLTVTVHGTPAPQGSKLRTRFGLIDDNAKTLKPWRQAVAAAAEEQAHESCYAAVGEPRICLFPIEGPVEVEITITIARPRAHYRTGRNAHLLRDDAPTYPLARGVGDIDKYARAICDSLTTAGVWGDDVQVVELTARKTYPETSIDALDRPGAVIHVRPMATTAVVDVPVQEAFL